MLNLKTLVSRIFTDTVLPLTVFYMTLHEKIDAYMPQPQFVFSYWRYLFVRPKKNLFICNGEMIQQKLRSLKI